MIRTVLLSVSVLTLALGLAAAAHAQQTQGNTPTPKDFSYEVKDGKRVEKPDNRTVQADGTVREEFRSGKCVTIKEKRPDGAVKTTRKCD